MTPLDLHGEVPARLVGVRAPATVPGCVHLDLLGLATATVWAGVAARGVTTWLLPAAVREPGDPALRSANQLRDGGGTQ
ncbi:hypothetical protein [Actinoplanes subtropicus]|uniref:hypothetical protein n=1 Tax=Actinoplanes subtropicus TaxID=543632 RepID=UPI0004C43270|nr:hypothetical protein [Actinoplanes subtropicus]